MRCWSARPSTRPEDFATLVERARAAVVDTFEEDTLVEAIARELERSHGFTYIGDEKLTASDERRDGRGGHVPGRDQSDEFRSIIVELDLSSYGARAPPLSGRR